MEHGPFAGYPVVDMRVTLYDGSYHEVDSSDFAFQEAARVVLPAAVPEGAARSCSSRSCRVEVVTPEEFMGAGHRARICQRRGRIEAMERKGEHKIIRGMVPLSEMFGYSNASAP